MTQSSNGYSNLSITLHWIAAIAFVALFISHEGESDSAMLKFHVSGGALLGVILFWRVVRRPARGFASKPEQNVILNRISTFVMWGLLLSIFVIVVTGYLIPWTLGKPLDIFGLVAIPSFMDGSPQLHRLMEQAHDLAGHVIIPLVLLHVLGALKHWLFDRDGVMQRMLRPLKGGN